MTKAKEKVVIYKKKPNSSFHYSDYHGDYLLVLEKSTHFNSKLKWVISTKNIRLKVWHIDNIMDEYEPCE